MPSAIRQSGPRPAAKPIWLQLVMLRPPRGLPTTAQRVGEQTGLEVWPGEEVGTTRLCPGLVRSLGSRVVRSWFCNLGCVLR